MYILVRDDVPLGIAAVAIARASLAAYLKIKGTSEVADWLNGPFYKVVCKVSAEQFEQAKQTPDHVMITASKLDNQEVAIAFKPREEWPKAFKLFPLYR